MFQVGDLVEGLEYTAEGDEVTVIGTFVARTDDPEEYIQDIIIKTEDGRTVYIDEQVARPHKIEVKWALAKVMNGFAYLQNERFHTFAIKKNGDVVGELKFASRPKTAGGPAWRAKLFNAEFGMDVCYYSKNKNEVLEWVKENGNARLERGNKEKAND